jgi:hypothetical protein
MRDHRSNFQDIYNHPNIVVSLSVDLDSGADWLLAYFESEIQRGITFRADETVQIGWMIVKLKSDDNGDLEVWEPKFDSIPISWVRGASNTIRHLTIQKAVCAQVGVEPDFPSLSQSGVIPSDFLDYSGAFIMSREAKGQTDSGWIFSKAESAGLDGRRCSLFEISIRNLAIIPFLALPVGTSVRHAIDGILISFESIEISADSNEFLRRLLLSKEIRQ